MLMPSLAASYSYPVAGVEPWKRPSGAPTIKWASHNKVWYQRALTGISPPYPTSLNFLDRQGYWHTPFNQPGMTGPYDIRGWHQPALSDSPGQ